MSLCKHAAGEKNESKCVVLGSVCVCLCLCGLVYNIPCKHLIRGERLSRFSEPAAFCSQNKHAKVYGLQFETEVKKALALVSL